MREIEQRLYEMASHDERALLEEFLRTSRRRSTPVLSIGNDMIMANPAASRLLQPADQSLLWEWACDQLGTRDEATGEVRLTEGHQVRAKVRRVNDDRRTTGVVLELQEQKANDSFDNPLARSARHVTVWRDVPRMPGRSDAARLLQRELGRLAEDPGPTLITGDAGVGKTFTARHLHGLWTGAGELLVDDLALIHPAESAQWSHAIRSRLARGATVLLRHSQSVPDAVLPVLSSVVDLANACGWHLIATAPDGAAGPLSAHFRRRVAVPTLTSRVEDLEDISREILRTRARGGVPQRLQSATLNSLRRHDWPGNIRELESILHAAAASALGGDIGLQHLPVGYRKVTATRNRSALERAEIDALLTALRECHGNKSLAAAKLGVARSTLYRKVREYGIDTERFISHDR